MSEWHTFKLKDITTKIGSGSTPTGGSGAYKTEGISLIRSQNVLDYKFTKDGLAFIDDDQAYGLRNVIVEANDVLLNITGDSVARCCGAPTNWLPARVNQHVAILRSNPEKLDHRFLKYSLLASKEELLILSEIGGTRNALTKGMLEDYEVSLPFLPEQKAIASVLSSLDDKIDLLHRQNRTLEAMAETLFRHWFIEEAKEDWEEADLTQLIELQSGYAFKSKDFQESGSFGVIKIKNISGNIIDIGQTDFVADEIGLATAQRFHVKSGQVLIAMTGAEIGKLGLIPKTTKQLLLNQRVGLLVPRFKGAEYLAYLHLKSEFGQDYIENSATGSAQPNISGSLIEACPFPKIDDELLGQYGVQVQIYYEKVKENLGQIQTLEKLRDTLLPKLMSGEVRVQYQTEEVA